MSTTTTYRIDIDGTIAEPRFFDENFQTCIDCYLGANIVKQEEVASLTFHQQLFLLPHVLVTHKPVAGSVEMLSCLVRQGYTLQYFTVRQAIDPPVCRMVHENTRVWLETMYFPCASAVSFFWDAGEKLLRSLDAPEDRIMLIDDRPSGLARAYEAILGKDPDKARQIREQQSIGTTHHYVEAEVQSNLQCIALGLRWFSHDEDCGRRLPASSGEKSEGQVVAYP